MSNRRSSKRRSQAAGDEGASASSSPSGSGTDDVELENEDGSDVNEGKTSPGSDASEDADEDNSDVGGRKRSAGKRRSHRVVRKKVKHNQDAVQGSDSDESSESGESDDSDSRSPQNKQAQGQQSLLQFAKKGVSNVKPVSSDRFRGGKKKKRGATSEKKKGPRRSSRAKTAIKYRGTESSSDEKEDEDVSDKFEEGSSQESETGSRPRRKSKAVRDLSESPSDSDQQLRSRRSRKTKSKKEASSSSPQGTRRSSRSNKFRASMADPTSDSIRDLINVPDRVTSAKLSRDSSESDEDVDSDSESEKPRKALPRSNNRSAPKSPAARHKTKRRQAVRKPLAKKAIALSDESGSEEMESSDDGKEDGDQGHEEDEDEMKVQRIIASKLLPRKDWRKICEKMNTSEIDNGSRWYQSDGEEDGDTFEERFLVKWAGLSFLHVSWESEADLLDQIDNSRSYLNTFFRKSVNGVLYTADERGDGEFFDPAYCQIDRILEIVEPESIEDDGEDKTKTGRKDFGMIFDKNDPDYESGTGRQFLIKWDNMSYLEGSYEFERDLVMNEVDYEQHVKDFFERAEKPSKTLMQESFSQGDRATNQLKKIFRNSKLSESEKEDRVKKYQDELAETVFKNGGSLRDYQAEGVAWMIANHVNGRSSILADEMGLGKTIQTAVFLETMASSLRKRGPYLVVAPLSTIPNWHRELQGWTHLNAIVYHGSAENRDFIRQYEFAFEEDRPSSLHFKSHYLKHCHKKTDPKWKRTWQVQVVITSPEMLIADDYIELAEIKWEVLVFDEAHRLKNHSSKLANIMRSGKFHFHRTLLLTGTPIQNNMSELWTLLNFIDAEKFGDLNDFLEKYGDMKSKERVDDLHEQIRPFILRRLKEDVEKSVPPKEETVIEVELTVVQKKYYRALYEKNVKFLHRNTKKAMNGPSLLNIAMQLRKCCNHPFLLNGVEQELRKQAVKEGSYKTEADFLGNASGKLVLLDKLLPRLKEDGHRILIFSQFKIMLDILEDYFRLRSFNSERIDGSITGQKRQNAIDRFQTQDTAFIMMLSTRAGGVGINLTAADTCIIFDSDFNPQNDLQAQARCHRIGQKKNVKIYRLLSRKTYEMQMFHMSSLKMGLDQAVLQGIENKATGEAALSKKEIENLLKRGAYDIFNEDKTGKSEAESNQFVEMDIDSIMQRCAKTVVHENTGSTSGAAGGTFSKASFKVSSSEASGQAQVELEDPDFWKKTVGEAHLQGDSLIIGTKRRRRETNYQEVDVDQVHDDSSFASDKESGASDAEGGEEATQGHEPHKWSWGNSNQAHWSRKDAERVVKGLQVHGYHPGKVYQFTRAESAKAGHDESEVKRMAWAILLTSLLEVSEEEQAKSLKAASLKDMPVAPKAEQIGTFFRSNVQEHESWVDEVLKDAEAFVRSHKPRSEAVIERAFNESLIGPVKPKPPSPLIVAFYGNLWPALKSRGWKGGGDIYTKDASFEFGGKQFSSMKSVLEGVQKQHPELEHVVRNVKLAGDRVKSESGTPTKADGATETATPFETILWPKLKELGWVHKPEELMSPFKFKENMYPNREAVLDEVEKSYSQLAEDVKIVRDSLVEATQNKEGSTVSEETSLLDSCSNISSNVNPSIVKEVLRKFGPLQLLFDRTRPRKLNLSKVLLNVCSRMAIARQLVSLSKMRNEEDFHTLSKLVQLNSKALPAWKARNDAVLVYSIVQHGWVASMYEAIVKHKSFTWNLISSDDPETESMAVTGNRVPALKAAASAAVSFLNSVGANLEHLKGFDWANVAKELCLRRTDDDSWSMIDDEQLLASKAFSEKAIRPTKQVLWGRAKQILSRPTNTRHKELSASVDLSEGAAASQSESILLDQKDKNNILLAELLTCMLKLSARNKPDLWMLVADAAKEEAKRMAEMDKDVGLQQILQHVITIGAVRKTALSVESKNILRQILGLELVSLKSPVEGTSQYFGSVDSSGRSPTASGVRGEATGPAPKIAKIRRQRPCTIAGNAISRAINVATHKKGGTTKVDGASSQILALTSFELLLVFVCCSQGYPAWSDDWANLVSNVEDLSKEDENDLSNECRLTWPQLGEIVENAATNWHRTAAERFEGHTNKLSEMRQREVTPSKLEKQHNLCLEGKLDLTQKEETLRHAREMRKLPRKLAQKTIMLLEALTSRMGHVDANRGGDWKKMKILNKSEHGLGPKVLQWCKRDLVNWAESLNVVDKSTHMPLSLTDGPHNVSAAIFDKKASRCVMTQVSQLARLRSLFVKNGNGVRSLVAEAVANSEKNGDSWADCPQWWNKNSDDSETTHDFMLLSGILQFGYSGFDVLQEGFRKHLQDDSIFNMESVQPRINHLTRELSLLEDKADMIRFVRERTPKNRANDSCGKRQAPSSADSSSKKASTVQTGIGSYFTRAPNEKPKIASSVSPEGSYAAKEGDADDTGIIETVTSAKRKVEMNFGETGDIMSVHCVELSSPDKRPRTNLETTRT